MKKVSQRELRSAIMILIAYGLELKAQGFQIDDKFGDYDFDIHFTINQVTNWKTKDEVIKKDNEKIIKLFEAQIKKLIETNEKIIIGEVKEK